MKIEKMERIGIMPIRSFIYGGQMLRSIKNANTLIHQQDKDSAVTVHTIRTWCKEKKVKSLTVGNKILVDVQDLMDYINMKRN